MNYESKNEYYLLKCECSSNSETGAIYFKCVYTNGLITEIIPYKVGDFIPTILKEI